MRQSIRKLIAECFGTYALVFAGTGAIIVNDVTGGTVSHLGIAVTFGLIVLAMIYSVGDVSGSHLNPAVTIGLLLARRFDASMVIPYVSIQILGAVLASLTLGLLFPTHPTLGATLPAGGIIQSFVLEGILTLILMFVILNVTGGPEDQRPLAGAVIGAVVGLEALFAGPICGASMNPARSIGPAVASSNLTALWIYLIAPLLGATLGVICYRLMRGVDSHPIESKL